MPWPLADGCWRAGVRTKDLKGRGKKGVNRVIGEAYDFNRRRIIVLPRK